MFTWAMIFGGALVLPLALLLRPEIPMLAAEILLVVGTLTMFLSICASESRSAVPIRVRVRQD